jgi:hypothetical protein
MSIDDIKNLMASQNRTTLPACCKTYQDNGSCNKPLFCYSCAKRYQRNRAKYWYDKIKNLDGNWYAVTIHIDKIFETRPPATYLTNILQQCNEMYKQTAKAISGIFTLHILGNNEDYRKRKNVLKPHLHGLILASQNFRELRINGLNIRYEQATDLQGWLSYMLKYPIDEYNQHRGDKRIDRRFLDLIEPYQEFGNNPVRKFNL